MTQPVTVLLADDHAMVRGTLSHLLEAESDLKVVASVGSTDEAVVEAIRLKPDVVLMDIDMPGVACFQAARTIQEVCPHTRVVFLSAFFHDRYIEQALAARAWGYIVKSESAAVVVSALRKIVSGMTYYSPDVQSRLIIDQGTPRLAAPPVSRASILSERELEVLRHIARGLSQKEIAQALHISANTVHRHTASIMSKLDVHDRVALARFAIREGLAEP
jgi:DNA-binding NarL/FixJ family response regulator